MSGCATHPRVQEKTNFQECEAGYYWGRNTWLTLNSPPMLVPPQNWCLQANDDSLSRERRSLAAGVLFGAYVSAGFTTDGMRKAIPDPRWHPDKELKLME